MSTETIPTPDFCVITGVLLGGFQVFDEPTYVPLGKLTFLFGPNSAGKSAVEDALVLLGSLFDSSGDGEPSNEQLKLHWRKLDGAGDNYAPLLTLGLTAHLPTYLPAAFRYYGKEIEYPPARCGHEMSATFRYEFDKEYWEGNELFYGYYEFRLDVDGMDLLAIDQGKRLGIRFSHPLMDGANLTSDFHSLASTLPDHFSDGDGWVWFNSRAALFSMDNADWHRLTSGLLNDHGHWPTPDQLAILKPALNEFIDVFDEIKSIVFAFLSASQIVGASRTIPGKEELTHLCDLKQRNGDTIEAFGLLPKAGKTYRHLAESCFIERTGSRKTTLGAGLIAGVNRALSDYLFLERGYQVAAKFQVMLDLEYFAGQRFPKPDEIENYPVLVRIFLVDSQGRQYSFEQVGSGLGYVLPVLCSIFNPQVSVSLLQQPELHLHPALQAALGDVFIEAAKPGHQIIVETHSEHLLLRILKRIRQTFSANPPVPELRLKPEDVVVAYFDPKPDGTTTVRRLRISNDGEFLDRWPRGFFTERDQELFDE